MLTPRDTDLLCQTGPGTPMGALFRRFWLPALLPDELPTPDCPPIRFRMLSEDLVAFRDSSGRIAFMQQACPHRGASMFFGRNEEDGLRCVYHGWKFDVSGACTDMPNEPAESNFKHKIRATTYPGAEWGGLVWIYMGPADRQPGLPQYDWCLTPNPGRQYWKWMQESNYLQGLEGNIDSSHASFLHSFIEKAHDWNVNVRRGDLIKDGAPHLTAKETPFGFIYGAARQAPDEQHYWRVTPFVLPTYTVIPNPKQMGSGFFVLPMDDEHSWWFTISETPRPDRPGTPPYVELAPGTWKQTRNLGNDYLLDREMQRTVNYSGLPTNRVQDAAVTETMGPVMDRTKEHLASADLAIIFMRRMLLRLARQLEQGVEPELLQHPEWHRVKAIDAVSSQDNLGALWDDHHARVLQATQAAQP